MYDECYEVSLLEARTILDGEELRGFLDDRAVSDHPAHWRLYERCLW